jgi:hypothetical protein
MKIESFEITEQGIEGKIENFDESKDLVEKLGLEGQTKFYKTEETTKAKPKSRNINPKRYIHAFKINNRNWNIHFLFKIK